MNERIPRSQPEGRNASSQRAQSLKLLTKMSTYPTFDGHYAGMHLFHSGQHPHTAVIHLQRNGRWCCPPVLLVWLLLTKKGI